MTNMFKKSLLALAVAGASTSAAAVEVVASDDTKVSKQALGIVSTFDTVASDTLTITLGAEYAVGDIVKLTFSEAALDTSSAPTSISAAAAADDGAGSGTSKGLSGITFGLINSSSSELTYRVTEINNSGDNDGDTTIGQDVVFLDGSTSYTFDASEVSDDIDVTYSAETDNGITLDSSGNDSDTIVSLVDQFTGSVDRDFAAEIDVEQDRKQFVESDTSGSASGNGTDNAGDYVLITVNDNSGTTDVDATLTKVTHTITGDFSWVVDTDSDNDGIQPAASVFTANACTNADLTVESDKVTLECDSAATVDLYIDTSNNNSGAEVLPTTSFEVTSEVAFNDGGSNTGTYSVLSDEDAGEWTLNGADVYVPYMPYGKNISQVIYVTNKGSQTGAISVDVNVDGETKSYTLDSEAAPGITKISGDVLDAVQKAFGNKNFNPLTGTDSTKASFTIVVNAPSDDIEVYTGYNVNSNDRGYILNSSNRTPASN